MHRLLARRTLARAAMVALLSPAVVAPAAQSAASFYVVKNLVSDDGSTTRKTDPNLVNGWGLAAGPGTPWWVANNGTSTSTLYVAGGFMLPLVVNVPGGPTGIVYNGGTGFVLPTGRRPMPALFLFATQEGKILGWNTRTLRNAFVAADNSGSGAEYTGLAIANPAGGDRLYAANFGAGRVDCFDAEFHALTAGCEFMDPGLPSGYAPFGIQTIGDHVYVAYALRDPDTGDEVKGAGLGYVDAYDTSGAFVDRVASQGDLDAPWGIALAPAAGFGDFSGHLLVSNFGDGRILGYEAAAPHAAKGPLKNRVGRAIAIDGLWGIAFGNGGLAGPTNVLYFAAGPEDETHGLFGLVRTGGRSMP
jgi:uncharacterized protein (TIGR03118 family)